MSKRHRYGDQKSVGKSKIVPFRNSEVASERHYRRLNTNLKYTEIVGEWCKSNNVLFDIKNNGHHWIFIKNNKKVEWWPSSAKMVIQQKWQNGIHVHDYEQALDVLKKAFL